MEDITDNLIKVIKNMPEKERYKLYKALEKRYPLEKRKHDRVAYHSKARYTSLETFGEDLLQDISSGGVFLKTMTPFTVGCPITLIISSTNGKMNIKAYGEIVRVTPDGVGIQFIRKV
jgi:hypothetical protein